jgi:hypothetical protein
MDLNIVLYAQTVLDKLGVSVAERHKVTNNVLKKCLVAYKGALEYEKNRCSSMAEAISDLEAQHRELCSVLGEKDALLEERMVSSGNFKDFFNRTCIASNLLFLSAVC